MKITILTYIYPYPNRGFNPGIERVVQEVARGLDRQDHEVHVITTFRNGGTEAFGIDSGVRIHRVPDTRSLFGRIGSLFSFDMISLNFSMAKHKDLLESSDIVHTFTPIFWKFFSTPLIAHYHHWDEPDNPFEYLYLPTSHRLWKRCYTISDKIIAVSDFSADDLGSRGIARNKICVVPNGVDTNKFSPMGPSQRFDEFSFVLLYVGPQMERKGIQYLLQAMPSVNEEFPDAGLVIVGSGDGKVYDEAVKQETVNNMVRFAGFVSEEDLPSYYRSADVFVFPSLLEGFGMVLVEAMACGVPVISTQATAIPEVVGSAGILVPKADANALAEAIVDLLRDERMRQDLGNCSVRRVLENFTWEKSVKEILEVYKETM